MTEEKSSPTVDINYIKAAGYREISCDGILGGPTPSEKMWLAFYSERLPIPKLMRHSLQPGGGPDEWALDPKSPPVVLESRTGVVRNVEVGLYMSIDTAEQLRDWLTENIIRMKEVKR
ncbi:hypothetical protein ELH49_20715 [Rhizobium ruizarguesonis]|uniref:hypothetical protein n=1 Tax=Rhizobium TaxID=379 RepID=UPI001032348A|nr:MULTISPECIES: hypothetical protein [Rhizobium]MBY5488678.1 hypothetical protein [Rhizobium leguminosarum]TBB46301.1 hypothetical protein ELH49_20715 [Rhizobium ruizarguesonis]TBC42735.1 hypothetical protein ELH31_02680 [Rhizobium ruizarguesonis]